MSPPGLPHAAGFAALAGLAACMYTVPLRSCRAAPPSAPKATRSFNVLWHGRALLALLLTAWGVSKRGACASSCELGRWRLAHTCAAPASCRDACPPAFFPPGLAAALPSAARQPPLGRQFPGVL